MAKLDPNIKVTLVESLDDVLDLKVWLGERRPFLGCDIETTGLNLGRDRIRLLQVGDLKRGWAIPFEDWRGAVKEFLPVYRAPIAFHNATFDLAFLERDGISIPEVWVEDSMIMAHLINPVGWVGLKPLAAKLIGPQALMGKDYLTDVFHSQGWNWETVPIDHPAYWLYSAFDTCLTAGIAEDMYPRVQEEYKRVYEVEMGCVFVLRDARLRGIKVDLEYVNTKRAQLMADMAELRTKIPIDPGKDAQVRDVIERTAQRGPLGSWWPFRTDKGEVSVDKDALQHFEDEFPDLIPPIRRWREKSKIVGTYLNNILKENVDSVVRPNIRQVAAKTARMSITEPALQTLPRGRIVRDAFVSREGHKIVLADYEQAELRVFSYYAQCQPMIDAFRRGEDLHAWVASHVYHGGDVSAVQREQRQVSKNVQFARLYGAGAPKIALTAGVSVDVITDFMERYNQLFPEVVQFQQALMGQMHQRLREDGEMWVKTILGRRLVVDKDKPYVGVNYLVQCGATSDLIKLKLCQLDAAGLGQYIRLPIHDEIMFEVPDDEVNDVRDTIRRVMPEHKLFGATPLTIETDIVERWAEHYESDPTKRFNWPQEEANA